MFSKKKTADASNPDQSDLDPDGVFSSSDSNQDTEILTDANPYADNQTLNSVRPTKPSIISEGFEFVGNITSEGALNIAGVVKGKVSARSILVDVEGYVEGELSSDILVVKGKIVGDVTCQELNIGPRALIEGTISYQHIHVQRGGKIAGKFNKT
jgi:cytoskeletal protein CcmA (bactofilin family)